MLALLTCLFDLLCLASLTVFRLHGKQFAYIGDLLMSFGMPLGSNLDALGLPGMLGSVILEALRSLGPLPGSIWCHLEYLGWPGDP